jgi:hypothetical protein
LLFIQTTTTLGINDRVNETLGITVELEITSWAADFFNQIFLFLAYGESSIVKTHYGDGTNDAIPTGDKSMARKDRYRNESHARQEDGSQYECLEGSDDGLPRNNRGTSGVAENRGQLAKK